MTDFSWTSPSLSRWPPGVKHLADQWGLSECGLEPCSRLHWSKVGAASPSLIREAGVISTEHPGSGLTLLRASKLAVRSE